MSYLLNSRFSVIALYSSFRRGYATLKEGDVSLIR